MVDSWLAGQQCKMTLTTGESFLGHSQSREPPTWHGLRGAEGPRNASQSVLTFSLSRSAVLNLCSNYSVFAKIICLPLS